MDGVILAAGFSSRAGCFKPERLVSGVPLLLKTLQGLRAVCSRIIVVAGYESTRIEALLQGQSGVELVLNQHYESGMFSSVQCGVSRVDSARFCITPVDCPLAGQKTICQLAAADGDVVIPVYEGRRGHPVVLSQRMKDVILAEPADSNLRAVIRRQRCVEVQVSSADVLLDLDTPGDFRRLAEEPAEC